jgi:signal transduction histidine kinase
MERLEGGQASLAQHWRNPAVRNLAVILGILLILCIAFAVWYTRYSAAQLKQEWLNREAARVGLLAAEHPEWAEEWIGLLGSSTSPSPDETENGRRILERYGLDTAIRSGWLPVIGDYRNRTLWSLILGACGILVLAAALIYRESSRQQRTIRRLAVSMENAVKHNEPMAYRLYEDGDLGLLASGALELSVRLRETIEQLHREKAFLKDTVADISHQLKTPLASLMIYVDLLQDRRLDADHAAEFLDRCRRELDRMEWLTLTLLKLARLEADTLEMNLKESPLQATVQEAVSSVSRLAEDKGVRIVVNAAPVSLAVPHDAHWLGEAIANLLKNAIEHSPADGEVALGWEQSNVFTRLHVQDQGPGIRAQDLPHIFKKFYRSSDSGSGVGLGLPLAKSIVEKHGGVLSVTANPAGGTIFHLTLPLHPFPSSPSNLTEL